MTNRLLSTILRKAEALTDGPTDADLLHRCGAARDDAAFAVLIHRHGPMVWAVCRRMLPNPADAEDAFQAVFLAVVRSAAQLGRVNSLGGWLHGVAVRACLQLRRGAIRRKQRERASAKPEAAGAEPQWADLHAAVHEEVERLPAALRTAFVLCELQGVRQPDAAALLGWKLGTLSGRLTRARQQLLKNLTARGLTPLAVAGAVGGAGLPAALADQAMAMHTIGPDAVSGLSPTVLELARGATEGMMTKMKWTVGSLMMAGGLLVAIGGLPTADAQRPSKPPPASAPKPPTADTTRSEPELPPGADSDPTATPAPRSASRTPASSIQRFEHLVVNTPASPESLRSLFQEQEKQGWEYVGTISVADPAKQQLVFKRPKGGATSTIPTATYPTPSPRYGSADTLPALPGNNPLVPSSNDPTSTTPAPAGGNTLPALPPGDLPPKTTTRDPAAGGDPKPAAKLPSGFETVPLKHAKATELAKTLRELFVDDPTHNTVLGSLSTPAFSVSADDRTNSVIFRAGRGATSKEVKAMIEKLDTPAARTVGRGDKE